MRGGEEQPCTAKGKSAQVVQSEERVRRLSCTRGVREVVDVWVEVMVAAGRARVRARVVCD